MNEADAIDEPLEQVLQHGMAIAAQLGREVSRVWQLNMEQKATRNGHEASRMQMAFDSEKQVAVSLLAPTLQPQWWEESSPRELMDAYRVATAWKDHAPEAAEAELHIRTEASSRYGVDANKLARESAVHSAPILETDLAKLSKAQEWAKETGRGDILPSFYPEATRMRNLLNDYEAKEAAAIRAEGTAAAERNHGDVQSKEAADELAHSQQESGFAEELLTLAKDQPRESRTGADFIEMEGVSPADEAWYRDLFLTDTPENQQVTPDVAEARDSSARHEQQGERVLVTAGTAYNSAERQEALADRMRAAGAPERGIAARKFAESQQKHPINHAAKGDGKTVNKVRANQPKKNQVQAQQRSK